MYVARTLIYMDVNIDGINNKQVHTQVQFPPHQSMGM